MVDKPQIERLHRTAVVGPFGSPRDDFFFFAHVENISKAKQKVGAVRKSNHKNDDVERKDQDFRVQFVNDIVVLRARERGVRGYGNDVGATASRWERTRIACPLRQISKQVVVRHKTAALRIILGT